MFDGFTEFMVTLQKLVLKAQHFGGFPEPHFWRNLLPRTISLEIEIFFSSQSLEEKKLSD